MNYNLRRVIVVGTSGSGKTTFARRLAEILDVPHFELDQLHWGPNWTPKDMAEFRQLTEAAVAGERWVIDGNYSKVQDIIWSRQLRGDPGYCLAACRHHHLAQLSVCHCLLASAAPDHWPRGRAARAV